MSYAWWFLVPLPLWAAMAWERIRERMGYFMRNAYYVQYDRRGFANCYDLWYCPSGEVVPDGWERITRREAVRLCAAERRRRKADPAFSGYAPEFIFPAEVGRRLQAGGVLELTDRTFAGYLVPPECCAVVQW